MGGFHTDGFHGALSTDVVAKGGFVCKAPPKGILNLFGDSRTATAARSLESALEFVRHSQRLASRNFLLVFTDL
jgi:hypothetical protein